MDFTLILKGCDQLYRAKIVLVGQEIGMVNYIVGYSNSHHYIVLTLQSGIKCITMGNITLLTTTTSIKLMHGCNTYPQTPHIHSAESI